MRRFRDVCLLGLVLGLSGCAGMQQRLASHPRDVEGSESRALASRGGRLRHQVAESPGRTPREPSAPKTAAKTGRPLTNRPPEAVSRYFPGMDRRAAGTAGGSGPAPEPEPARPDPLGVRTSAKQDAGNRPTPAEGRTRSGGEPSTSLPAALNVPVHPDDPSSLFPDALKTVTPGAGPSAAGRPRDEPASESRAVTLPEPVEAPKTDADATPTPEDSAAVDPSAAEGPLSREPDVVATSASTVPELPGLTQDQEPVVTTLGEADEPEPESEPVTDPDLPPPRAELPQARRSVTDTDSDLDNDPVLAGRPRLRLVRPGDATRGDAGLGRPPDDAFPASYYAVDPETRPAVAAATVASPVQARSRRTLFSRIFRRSGERRSETPEDLSARPEAGDLAQRRDLVHRVAADRLDEAPER